jgi:hypothetical protein
MLLVNWSGEGKRANTRSFGMGWVYVHGKALVKKVSIVSRQGDEM